MLPEPLPLGRATIDRDAERRTVPDLAEHLLTEPSTRVLVASRASISADPSDPHLVFLPSAVARGLADRLEGECFYLGRDDEHSYLALAIEEADRLDLPSAAAMSSLRDIGHALTSADVGLATTAVALAQWRTVHRHCPRCGEPTELTEAGWSARCPRDGSVHYPRTDPAVIMAVHDGAGRLLLARSAAWPVGRRSILAGFVDAGEGPESAVRREVVEEVSLAVGQVQYAGAQPWPFPGSLMLGYHAWLADGPVRDPRPDGVEITHADWFTRTELADAVASGDIGLPMRTSIARALIEAWFGGPIGAD